MKNKHLIVLSSLLALTGCTEPVSSEETSSSIPEESSVESSSSDETEIIINKECFDIGSRNAASILSNDTIYVYKDEPYYLNKLLDIDISFKTNMEEYLSISKEGIINVSKNDDEKPIKGILYIYNNAVYQRINLVIDSPINKHQNMSVDLARIYKSNVIFFGDSITHNWLKYPSGDKSTVNNVSGSKYGELGYDSSYVVQITKKAELTSAINAAWSGGTVAYLPRNNSRPTWKSLVLGVIDHEEDVKKADYAFIFYGTNDYTDQVEIGEINDPIDITSRKNANFKTSYNFAIQKLYEYNPDIKIIAMNVMYRTYPASGSFFQVKHYNAAIAEVCEANHVKVVDMYSLFDSKNFKAGSTYTDDGLHPNDAGYNVITEYLLKGVNNAK